MKTIFYRCVPHNPEALVFAEAQDARRVDRIWHALNTAKTWGQFKRLLPTSEHEQFEDCDAHEDDAFDGLDYTAEGDYPDWLQAQMEMFIPADLLARFGECLDTPLNGSFWSLPSRFETEIVAGLEGRGYRVFKRE